LLGVQLRNMKDKDEFVTRIQQFVEKRKLAEGEWILGAEWITRRVAKNEIIGIIALNTNCAECIVHCLKVCTSNIYCCISE
jgi:hypothetical protein